MGGGGDGDCTRGGMMFVYVGKACRNMHQPAFETEGVYDTYDIPASIISRSSMPHRIHSTPLHQPDSQTGRPTQICRAMEEAKGMMPMTVRMEMVGTTTSVQCGAPSKKISSGSSLVLSCWGGGVGVNDKGGRGRGGRSIDLSIDQASDQFQGRSYPTHLYTSLYLYTDIQHQAPPPGKQTLRARRAASMPSRFSFFLFPPPPPPPSSSSSSSPRPLRRLRTCFGGFG